MRRRGGGLQQHGGRIGRSFGFDRSPTAISLLVLLCVFLAFALRLHDLEGQSMWSDEGLSLYRARQPLSDVFSNVIVVDGVPTHDTNPPLYFLLLNLWRDVAGERLFALRFVGSVAGVIAVPLIYLLGKIAFDRRVGLVAAFFLAISPFHVWQSQVLRNYSLLITLNLLSAYGLFRFVLARAGQTRTRWLVMGVVAGLLGIYTHYFGFFFFAFGLCGLVGVGWLRWGGGRLFRRRWLWMIAGFSLLLALPVAVVAWSQFRAGRQFDFYTLPIYRVARHAAGAYAVGMDPSLFQPAWRVWPVIVLFALGVYKGWRVSRPSTFLLLGYQFIPLGILLALSLVNPLYNGTRHLLIGLPPFLLLVVSGVIVRPWPNRSWWMRAGQWLGFGLVAFMAVSQLQWLQAQFSDPRLIRDDVRGAATYLNQVVDPGDVVILHDALIQFAFDYYYEGPAPVVHVPNYAQPDPERAIDSLASLGSKADRIWMLAEPKPRDGFPRDLLPGWADAHWMLRYDREFPWMWLRVKLKMYETEPLVDAVPEDAVPLDAIWDGWLRLQGVKGDDTVRAGEDWWLSLFWAKLDEPPGQVMAVLRLVDDTGRVWAQGERVIGDPFSPVVWPLDRLVRSDQPFSVPPGLPTGRYQVWMHLVYTDDARLLPLVDGSMEIRLPDVTVLPTPCDVDLDDWWEPYLAKKAHIGREIGLRGFLFQPGQYRPGHMVEVGAFWCSRQQPVDDYRWRLQLVDANDRVVAETFTPLTRPDHPTTQWRQGELVVGYAEILLPGSVGPGLHELRMSLLPSDADQALPVNGLLGGRSITIGRVEVVPWPLVTVLPASDFPIQAQLGDPPLVELHGYDLEDSQVAPGDTLELSLVWRSVAEQMNTSYAVFIHLTDDAGEILAQDDGRPVQGFRPTTSWRYGEVLSDTHQVSIPAYVPEGTYQLWTGLYDPATKQRLPVFADGERQPDDRVLLGTITVAPK